MAHMSNTTVPAVSIGMARRACAEVDLDLRTMKRFLTGQPVRPLCAERARRGLAAVGVNLPTHKTTKE